MNISEFAKIAGVSKSAVSRYFNNGYLSDEKRELIEKALKETGYRPSIAAQNVKTRVTKLVGIIIPRLSSDSCARIVEGISEVLDQEGYELLLVNSANNYQKEVAYLDLFRNKRVDGVIFLASVFTKLHKSVLSKMRVPVVIAGQNYPGFSCVCHDDYGAAYAVTELMIKKGAKKPAYIGAIENDTAVGANRHRGFMQALTDSGLELMDGLSAVASFSSESGYENAKKILKNKPDCVFCATDTIASGVILYCFEKGIKIPDDLMIASVGDSKIGMVTSLTTAHLHYRTEGKEAARMLLSAISQPDSIPRVMQLGFEVIERNSTDKKM